MLVFIASLFVSFCACYTNCSAIIDKVLTQGNLSSLNVLAAMILMALFQGILQCLRTLFLSILLTVWILLLEALLLIVSLLTSPYFEKRPVGELSQRPVSSILSGISYRYCTYFSVKYRFCSNISCCYVYILSFIERYSFINFSLYALLVLRLHLYTSHLFVKELLLRLRPKVISLKLLAVYRL